MLEAAGSPIPGSYITISLPSLFCFLSFPSVPLTSTSNTFPWGALGGTSKFHTDQKNLCFSYFFPLPHSLHFSSSFSPPQSPLSLFLTLSSCVLTILQLVPTHLPISFSLPPFPPLPPILLPPSCSSSLTQALPVCFCPQGLLPSFLRSYSGSSSLFPLLPAPLPFSFWFPSFYLCVPLFPFCYPLYPWGL